MNFTEAVAELAAGRCKGIKRSGPQSIIYRLIGEKFSPDLVNFTPVGFTTTDWQLVDPVPQYEEVEERVMVGIYPDGGYLVAPKTWRVDYPIVEGKLTYRREIKPKVKRRKDIGPANFALLARDFDEATRDGMPSDADVYVEWEA